MATEKKPRKKKETESEFLPAPTPSSTVEECLQHASTLSNCLELVYASKPESEIYSNLNRVELLIRSLNTLINKK